MPLGFSFNALQLVYMDLRLSLRAKENKVETKVPAFSWKLYIYILQPKLLVMICFNVRLMHVRRVHLEANNTCCSRPGLEIIFLDPLVKICPH